MAVGEVLTSDALSQQKWSEGLEAEALKKTAAMAFLGSRSDSLLQHKEELSKAPGDTIKYGLRMQDESAPYGSSDTVEGNERTLTRHNDSFVINEMINAHRFKVKMDRQRVSWEERDEARAALADNIANAIDTSFFNQISGYLLTSAVDATLTGNNAAVAPSTGSATRHIFADPANNTAESTLQDVAADYFALSLIDRAVELAKVSTPSIRPANIVGVGQKYVVFIHPFQTTQLRIAAQQWEAINRDILKGGMIADNPILTGALGEYNGTLLVESTRIPTGVSSGVSDTDTRRAVFCGAQAAGVAWGRFGGSPHRFNWVEEYFDYEREMGISAGALFGLKKLIFDSNDFGTIVISTGAKVS